MLLSGTGQLAALQLGRNVISVDNDQQMLDHAVGRYQAANISVDEEEESMDEGSGDEGEPSGTVGNKEKATHMDESSLLEQ